MSQGGESHPYNFRAIFLMMIGLMIFFGVRDCCGKGAGNAPPGKEFHFLTEPDADQ